MNFVMTQNFKMKMNKETTFITRISGLGWLAFLKCLGGMDEDDAFTTSFVVSTICAIIGPINAELNLDCNTAHGAAWVLFPILLAAQRECNRPEAELGAPSRTPRERS